VNQCYVHAHDAKKKIPFDPENGTSEGLGSSFLIHSGRWSRTWKRKILCHIRDLTDRIGTLNKKGSRLTCGIESAQQASQRRELLELSYLTTYYNALY
jgi:hypothetical protein